MGFSTLGADEDSEDNDFELDFLRRRLKEAVDDCACVKKGKVFLTEELNDTKELLEQERRKAKKILTKLRKAGTRYKKKVGAVNSSEFVTSSERTPMQQVNNLNRKKEELLISSCDNKRTLDELLKSRKEIGTLTGTLEKERKLNLARLQDNTELLNENKKLKETVSELQEEIDAMNSCHSEMNETLTRTNEQINEVNSLNDRQTLLISAQYQRISTLECAIEQLTSEKEALLAHHSVCSELRNENQTLKLSYDQKCNRNINLSDGIMTSKLALSEVEKKIGNLQ